MPMTPPPGLWRIELRLPLHHAPAFASVLEDLADAVSWDTPDSGGAATVTAFAAAEPDDRQVRSALAAMAETLGVAAPPTDIIWLQPRDWVVENRAEFPPLTIGRFHVRGSHVTEPAPAGAIVIHLDAATAFGSGSHATTAGCLLELERLARHKRPARILDMGCGSGILAIAAARLWPAAWITATDVDPEAARVTRENARQNGVGARLRVGSGEGYRRPLVRAGAPYDLIVANILALPLKRLAGDLARHIAPDGTAVLSGLLARDAALVAQAHRAHGLALRHVRVIDGWATLSMRQGRAG